jgi:hypothetical protein
MSTEYLDSWQYDLENKSKLIFGHVCNSKIFRKYEMAMCNHCMRRTGVSYNWHITEEEYLFYLLRGTLPNVEN